MPAPRQNYVRLLPLRDFTGGINYRDDAFQLPAGESPDLKNVDLLPQGGMQRRKSVRALNGTPLAVTPTALLPYRRHAQILVQQGQTFAWGTSSGTFTSVGTAAPLDKPLAGRMRACETGSLTLHNESLYVCRNAEQTAFKWDGSAAAELLDASAAWNDTIAAPVHGRFPKARYAVAHNGFVFAAWTVEGGTTYKNRLRWSHPGEPEDWRSLDYTDVDPNDGDEITGLATLGNSLLVFKHRACYRLDGYSPDTFQLNPISRQVGAVSQEAIAAGPRGVAFFDEMQGMWLYDGGLSWLWPLLHPRMLDSTIDEAYRSQVVVGWMDQRLWVSVPWLLDTSNTRTFVWDTNIKSPSWTMYDFGLGPMLDWRPDLSGGHLHLACSTGVGCVLQLDAGTGADDFGYGDTNFESYYTTAWFDVGLHGIKKRWHRPHFVLNNDNSYQFLVQGWRNYQPDSTPNFAALFVRSSALLSDSVTSAVASAYDEGDAYDVADEYDAAVTLVTTVTTPLLWNTGKWGESKWGGFTAGSNVTLNGPALGRAVAVQLRFTGPSDVDWRLNAVQMPYLVTKVK